MSKRYRVLLGTAVIVAIGAVGGIAAAEQGGNSDAHRQNPTTTSAADTTTTTTLVHGAPTQNTDDQTDALDQSNRTAALCWALHQGSAQGQAMKAEHGQAFQNLDCTGVAPPNGDSQSGDVSDTGDQGQGGPPANPGQSADHVPGTNTGNGQGHGKP